MKFQTLILSVAINALAIPSLGIAAPGDVDLTFNPDANGQVVTAAIQPDGKIVMGGEFTAVGGTSRNRIARVNPDGSLDMGFNPEANGLVHSTAVQTDGKIIVGGLFTQMGGVTRNRIARLNADGSLDTGFNPNASNYVYTVVPQSDGKILIGGGFSTVGGITRQGIARLNADGSLDAGFNPIINGEATTVLLENDGQIIIGGGFTLVGGVGRSRIARLNSDGTLDLSFNPNANNTVYCAALDGSARILIGGSFSTVGGVSRANIARLNSNGTVDTDFVSYANSLVYSIATQTNGKSIIAGILTSTGGQPRNRIAKLSADGSVDTSFNPNANLEVNNAAIQENGDVVLSGFFSSVGGIARSKIARIGNEAATESLSISDSSRIEWMRGGASPETQHVTFELSTTGGVSWVPLGTGTRVAGGWELAGISLPGSGQIRARARTTSGIYCGSSGLVETVVPFTVVFPEIAVEQPLNSDIPDGGSQGFGSMNVGADSSLTFVVKNTGTAPLDISSVSVTGGNTGDFSVNSGGMIPSVPAGQSTSFSVTFSPVATGSRSTTLQISNNDGDEAIFDIALTGTGTAPEIEVRQPSFSIIADGGIKNFGTVAVNGSTSLVFTIKNSGTGDLTGLGITFDGTDSGVFSVTSPPVAPVSGPTGSTTFTVRFAPTTAGPKTAALHIANNDSDENPYDITLLGNVSAQEIWRQTHFGSIQNVGDGADLNDYEGDGLVNLTEYAFGLHPKQNSAGQLPQGQIIGPNYVVFFNRPSGVSGVTYGAEWSTTLMPLSWTPITDTGFAPQHVFSVPIGGNSGLFFRFKTTSP